MSSVSKISLILIGLLFFCAIVSAGCVGLLPQYDANVKSCSTSGADCHKLLLINGINLGSECFNQSRYDESLYYFTWAKAQTNFLDENTLNTITGKTTYWDSVIEIDTNLYLVTQRINDTGHLTVNYDTNLLERNREQYAQAISVLSKDYFSSALNILCKGNSFCLKSKVPRFDNNVSITELKAAEYKLAKCAEYTIELKEYRVTDDSIIGVYYFKVFENRQRLIINGFLDTVKGTVKDVLESQSVIQAVLLGTIILFLLFCIGALWAFAHNKDVYEVQLSPTEIFSKEFETFTSNVNTKYVFELWVGITIGFSLILSYVSTISSALASNNILVIMSLIDYFKSYPIYQLSYIFLLMWGLVTFGLFMAGILAIANKFLSKEILGAGLARVAVFIAVMAVYLSIAIAFVFLLYGLALFDVVASSLIVTIAIIVPLGLLYVLFVIPILKKLAAWFCKNLLTKVIPFIQEKYGALKFAVSSLLSKSQERPMTHKEPKQSKTKWPRKQQG